MEPPDQSDGDPRQAKTQAEVGAMLQWSRLTSQAETGRGRRVFDADIQASMEPPDQSGGDDCPSSKKLSGASRLQWSRLTSQAETQPDRRGESSR